MSNLFSGLEELGFKNLNDDIYKQNQGNDASSSNVKGNAKKELTIEDLLYDKSVNCPVCGNNFKTRAVKTGKARLISKDTDLMPRYKPINPLFYDVIICPKCGYSAMIKFFGKIKEREATLIRENISQRYKGKTYPIIYNVDIAIERFKLSLLNSLVKNSKTSEKAYTCLKLAWLYRIKETKPEETKFIEQAYIGLKESYEKESFPICGMDSFTIMYLIGELARRLGYNEEALKWFSNVIILKNVNPRLKELARDQKDLLREDLAK